MPLVTMQKKTPKNAIAFLGVFRLYEMMRTKMG